MSKAQSEEAVAALTDRLRNTKQKQKRIEAISSYGSE
jgi:hypothetical protein